MYLSQISNVCTLLNMAILTKKTRIRLPYSPPALKILTYLREEGLLLYSLRVQVKKDSKYKKQSKQKSKNKSLVKTLSIQLIYDYYGDYKLRGIVPISTPSRPVILSIKTLSKVSTRYGRLLLSTSKGILSDIEALESNIGGHLLLRIIV